MSTAEIDHCELLESAVNGDKGFSRGGKVKDCFPITDGLSGAFVWKCEIRGGKNHKFEGSHIVKAVSVDDYNISKHLFQFKNFTEDSVKFVGKYVVKPVEYTDWLVHNGYHFRFFDDINVSERNNGLCQLKSIKDETFVNVVKKCAKILLPNRKGVVSMNRFGERKYLSPRELLDLWIPERLEKNSNGFKELLSIRSALEYRAGYINCFNRHWPDPIYAIRNVPCFQTNDTIDDSFATLPGWLHNDFHMGNIFVTSDVTLRKSNRIELKIIDFDQCRESYLFYDHSYLKLSILLSIECEQEELILDNFYNKNPKLDVTDQFRWYFEAVQAIEDVINIFNKDIDKSNNKQNNKQAIIADIAAGLNWAGKKALSRNLRKRAYIFAAAAANHYGREFLGGNWSKELPKSSKINRRLGREQLDGENRNNKKTTSGHLLVNALLLSGYKWNYLVDNIGFNTIQSLCNGTELSNDKLNLLFATIKDDAIFENQKELDDFLNNNNIKHLTKTINISNSTSNSALFDKLQKLIINKNIYEEQAWIPEETKRDLIDISDWKELNYSLFRRSNMLRNAYYNAGINMTRNEMAEAAMADFSDQRWLQYFNDRLANIEESREHLNLSNQFMANKLFNKLPVVSPDRVTKLIEAGVGGGNTTYYVLKRLFEDQEKPANCIEYLGIELVPSLACSLNHIIKNPTECDGDLPELIQSLVNNPKSTIAQCLSPLLTGNPDYPENPLIVYGKMEQIIEEIAEYINPKKKIDAFFTSFAFHHVPNGNAIKSFIAGDSPNLTPSLADFNYEKRLLVAEAFASATEKYFENFLILRDENKTSAEIAHSCNSILQGYKDNENYSQVRVFLSLLNVGSLGWQDINLFCSTIREQFWCPRDVLDRLLHNPQLELLLTVQSMLRDGGVIAIADPDGMSDFNASYAASDPELTVANFTSSVTLAKMLETIGFSQVECYELQHSENSKADVVKKILLNSRGMEVANGQPAKGYIIIANRSQATEREISYNRRLNSGSDFSQFEKPDNEKELLVRIGEECARNNRGVARVISELLNPADPLPRSPQLFRKLPKLQSDLTSAGFIENCGGYVMARKRCHRIPTPINETENLEPKNITIFTDFPPTPQDLRDNRSLVFSYSDEAIVLSDEIQKVLSFYQNKNLKILDCCAGAGTLGILAKALCPQAKVVFTDSEDKSIEQIRQNLIINNMDEPDLLIVEKTMTDNSQPYIWPSKVHGPFDIILADPPFALRPQNLLTNTKRNSRDDGGEYGDNFSKHILREAPDWLTENGRLIILAYTLIEKEKNTQKYKLKIDKYIDSNKLDGFFEPVTNIQGGYVMRYRHDKIAKNDLDVGMPLDFVILRLGDTTRPESIVYESYDRAREIFLIYRNWLHNLQKKRYVGLQYVKGIFKSVKKHNQVNL